MADGANRKTVDDRAALVALLGEMLVAVLEQRGLRISVDLETDGDMEAALAAVGDDLAERRTVEVESQKLMALGQLGAGVVHEVRNHVTSIRGFAQVGRRKVDDPPEIKRILETVDRESARCVDTLSSYLGFARRRTDATTEFDAGEAVERAATLVRHQLAVHDVQLAVQPASVRLPVVGNIDAIMQIVVNLTLNAQQAMKQGGSVTIATRGGRGNRVEIVVSDTGPGIPAAVRPHIFEQFFTTKPRGEGTGLGLAISARIAQEHGGTLALEDSDGGACFVLALPGGDPGGGGR